LQLAIIPHVLLPKKRGQRKKAHSSALNDVRIKPRGNVVANPPQLNSVPGVDALAAVVVALNVTECKPWPVRLLSDFSRETMRKLIADGTRAIGPIAPGPTRRGALVATVVSKLHSLLNVFV
jgi:hypothetical protein